MRHCTWALLLLGGAATAWAQLGEISLSGGKSTPRNTELGTFQLDAAGGAASTIRAEFKSDVRIAVRFTVNNPGFRGQEFGYAYNHAKMAYTTAPPQEDSLPVHQGFYNFLLYATPEGTGVRPFVTGGVHFSTFYPPGTGVFSGNGFTKFGVNYGGGLKFRLRETLMLRLDVRDYLQPKPNFWQQDLKGWLHLLETSVGLGFAF